MTPPLYAGTILAFEDYQLKDGDKPRLRPDGSPDMGCRITLARDDLAAPFLQTLWAQSRPMLKAIAKAVKATGAEDVETGAHLTVTVTGIGPEDRYEAAYTRPEGD